LTDQVPTSGLEHGRLSSEEQKSLWRRGRLAGEQRAPDYIIKELEARLALGPQEFTFEVQTYPITEETLNSARAWDSKWNPSVAWPEDCSPWLPLGTLTLDAFVEPCEGNKIDFSIANHASCLSWTPAESVTDPQSIAAARLAVYEAGAKERHAKQEAIREKRVCIVGGGPCGLSTARELVAMGFSVTILEKEETIGGMCRNKSYDGHVFSLGGHMVFPSVYPRIRKLAKEYGLKLIRDFEGANLDLECGKLLDPEPPTSTVLEKARIFAEMAKKVEQMDELEGISSTNYEPGELADRVQRPLAEFMASHDLMPLWDRVAHTFSAAGYGTEEDRVPAEYYARFYNHTGADTMRYMFENGFQALWEGVAANLPDVRTCHTVTNIRRSHPSGSGPAAVQISWRTGTGKDESASFDAVVMAQSPSIACKMMPDLSPQELSTIAKVKTLPYFTLVVRASNYPTAMVGKWLFVTSGRHTTDPEAQTVLFLQPYEDSDATLVVGYCEHETDMGEVRRRVVVQAEKDLGRLGAKLGDILDFHPWPAYFPHFSPEDLAADAVKDAEALQGKGGAYYATTLFTFELTEFAVATGAKLAARIRDDFEQQGRHLGTTVTDAIVTSRNTAASDPRTDAAVANPQGHISRIAAPRQHYPRVCIVGGGPSGLSTAKKLTSLGFRVTLLEREESVGGMSRDAIFDGHRHSLGAHMIFPSVYPRIRKLAREYGLKLIPDFEGEDLDLAAGRLVKQVKHEESHETQDFLDAMKKFADIATHVDEAGIAKTGHKENKYTKELQRPLVEFMACPELSTLWARTAFQFSAVGYGTEEDRIPTEYYARYYNHTGGDTMRYMFQDGFQSLWHSIANSLHDIRVSHTVMDVRRHCPTEKGPSAVRVLWKNAQGQEQSDLFDAVVMAQSPGLAPRVMSDLTDQERKVMGKVKTLPYFTLYVRAPGLPSHMVGKHLFVTSSRHKLDLEVQTVLIFQPYEGSDATAVLGYCDHRDDMESVKREILRQARKDLANLGATMGEVLAYYPWPAYFPHFSPEDLAAGVAKDMDALQGNGGVYYATTLFTFELTEYAAAAGEALGERMSEDFASRFPELIPELNIPIYDVTTEALHQPAAQEPLDTKIAAVVGQVLKRGDILPDSDLFDMGLTSMDAGAIARALKDEVPECRELDMITVFENPSPAQLASFLGHAGHSDRPEPGNLSAVSSSPTIRRLDLDIARVVARVLKRDDILPDSDLFDMGLTSMDAGAIARALKEAVPECSDLDMITVFENPSPAQLASHLGHPAPSITKARNLTTREPPKGRLDLEIASVVGRILKRDDVLPESDLFDMGLTSVDAGAIAQALKDEVPLCKDLTMIAVFENSSPAMLAAFLQGTQLSPRNSSCNTPTTKSESPSPTFDEPREAKTLHSKEWISVTPGERAFLQKTATLASADKTLNCGSSLLIRALQVVLMPVVMLLSVGIPIYPSFVYLTHTLLKSGSIHEAILVTPVLAVSFAVVQLLLALMVKWVVIGRYRCGSHKIWGWYHLRWWFVDSIMAFPNCVIMPCVRGTFVARWWFTLLGAKIHPTAMFDTCRITECDLVSLGPGSVIQYDASLSGAVICADGLLLANVTVESGATVGLRAQLEPTLGDRAGFSFAMAVSVPDGALVPPMRGAESVRYPSEADLGVYQHQPSLLGQIAGIALTIAVHWASFVPYIYALVYLVVEKRASDYTVAAVAALYPLLPAHAYILVLILCQHIRKLLGVKSTNRWWRWWLSCAQSTFFFTLMTRMLAATPVCTWMMRAMGMRIKGNSVMFGVPWTVDYDHITIGPDFVSGGRNYICTVDRSGILRPVTLGRNVTLGNEVNIEPGAILGDNCTLGDATTIGAKCQIPTSATAIGSGPIVLRSGIPRQAIQLNVNWCTGTMLQLSATLPVYASVVVGSLLCAYCAEYAMKHGWSPYEAAVFFPSLTRLAEQDFTNAARGEPELARWTAGLSGTFLLFMVGFMATVLSVLFKRLFQYHFEPFSRHEYYSVHHCMWEANLVMMNVTYDAFMWLFRGWGGFCSWMRILGARIGDRVCTFAFTTEADLLRIGNDVVIGRDCVLDAHTIAEQRMAMDPICIGNGVNLGNRTHVIAGGVINSNAAIRSFSLVLSGEAIGEGTWSGQPIRRTKANLYNVA
jgi:protoporphyrinogen oxidase/acetyltransferase-like isoleucine patch superfamily enzyme